MSLINQIIFFINNRLSRNSTNEGIFNAASEPYQQALETSGYDFKLKQQQQKKKRSRRITWFNPPFSLNVKTNVGAIFLQIIKDCFPKDHILHKICNPNTIKVSYRTMPNIKRHISRHNNKILQDAIIQDNPRLKKGFNCNCQQKATCPMPGKCNTDNVVYTGHLTWQGNTTGETYTGVAKNFKKRYGTHKWKMDHEEADHTTLSDYIWTNL